MEEDEQSEANQVKDSESDGEQSEQDQPKAKNKGEFCAQIDLCVYLLAYNIEKLGTRLAKTCLSVLLSLRVVMYNIQFLIFVNVVKLLLLLFTDTCAASGRHEDIINGTTTGNANGHPDSKDRCLQKAS